MPIYKMNGNKNGKQKYRVRINFVDSYGDSRQIDRTAYGLTEAKDLEHKLLLEIKQETPARRITISGLYEEYLESAKNELRETTFDNNLNNIKRYVVDIVGDTPLSKLTVPFFQEWKNSIEGYISSKTKKPLSLKTKKNVYSYFRLLLNYAVKMDYITKNNLIKLGNFKDPNAKPPKEKIEYYTADEYKLFAKTALDFAKNSDSIRDWDFYVFFSIAFYTGLRKGEIYALKWSDIDENFLSVTRSIAQHLKGGDRETAPKNKSSVRTLQLPSPLINILNDHKERYSAYKGFSDDFRICGGTRPVRDTTVQNALKKIAAAAGIKRIRIHSFRHSHVSLLANEGINIQEIARRLGHSNIEMTWNTYSHLYPREEERAVEVLNKII